MKHLRRPLALCAVLAIEYLACVWSPVRLAAGRPRGHADRRACLAPRIFGAHTDTHRGCVTYKRNWDMCSHRALPPTVLISLCSQHVRVKGRKLAFADTLEDDLNPAPPTGILGTPSSTRNGSSPPAKSTLHARLLPRIRTHMAYGPAVLTPIEDRDRSRSPAPPPTPLAGPGVDTPGRCSGAVADL